MHDDDIQVDIASTIYHWLHDLKVIAALKYSLLRTLVPVARSYIRYGPSGAIKLYLWRRFAWRPHTYRVRTRFGAKMAGSSVDLVQGYIYYFGIWEPNLTEFILRRLNGFEGRTFIDIGANVGYFSLLASTILRAGHVVSIEAFPEIFEKLVYNIRINRAANIRALPIAVVNKECEVQMFHAGGLNEGATTSVPGLYESAPIIVNGRPLHMLVTEKEVRSTRLIKIDVEGAELQVLQGMAPIMDKLPEDAEIVTEVSPLVLGVNNTQALLDWFMDRGFFPYYLINSYHDKDYLFPKQVSRPVRLRSIPTAQMDVVFSRSDEDYL